jgi:hypothetical protein
MTLGLKRILPNDYDVIRGAGGDRGSKKQIFRARRQDRSDRADYAPQMQRINTDSRELCLSLVTAIVEQIAAAEATSSDHRFEIEARLLTQLMQDLPQQIEMAEQAARMITEEGIA